MYKIYSPGNMVVSQEDYHTQNYRGREESSSVQFGKKKSKYLVLDIIQPKHTNNFSGRGMVMFLLRIKLHTMMPSSYVSRRNTALNMAEIISWNWMELDRIPSIFCTHLGVSPAKHDGFHLREGI